MKFSALNEQRFIKLLSDCKGELFKLNFNFFWYQPIDFSYTDFIYWHNHKVTQEMIVILDVYAVDKAVELKLFPHAKSEEPHFIEIEKGSLIDFGNEIVWAVIKCAMNGEIKILQINQFSLLPLTSVNS
jgi:hypothetical protein